MRFWPGAIAGLALFFGCSFFFAAHADAHAYILSSTPAAQSSADVAPSVVTITFDEQIDLPDGPAIEVVDASGKRVDKNDSAIDPNDVTTVVVHLNPIAKGSYTVRWRVVSADTHVVHGTYSFGYGVAAGNAAVQAESPFDPSAPLASSLRWLAFLGIVAAVGAAFFRLAFRHVAEGAFDLAARRQMWAGAVIAILAGGALFVVQSIASAVDVARAVSATGLLSTLRSSFGIPWTVRTISLAVLAVCAVSRSRSAIALGVAAGAVALASLSLAGHATAPADYATPMTLEITDWVHLVSIAAWLGGLAVLAAGLSSSRDRTQESVRGWLARFSKLAVPAVVLMLASGVYASLAHEPHPTLLLTTPWGVSLVMKVALVVILLGFGAMSLRAGMGAPVHNSTTVLRVEAFLAVVILAVTAFLVGQSPPTCMFMPPGSRMPAGMKMPPGMQMCLLPHHPTQQENVHVE